METIYYKADSEVFHALLGSGRFADVYYDKIRKMAIKIYGNHAEEYGLDDIRRDLNNEEKVAKLTFLEDYNVVIPKKKVYVEQEYLGIAMRAIRGYSLAQHMDKTIKTEKNIPTIPLFSFLKAYRKLYRNVKELSKKHIELCDLNEGNIIWDKEKQELFIIDTQLIFEEQKIDVKTLRKRNKKQLRENNILPNLVKNKVLVLRKS